MELEKRKIYMNRQNGKVTIQATLDEERNVPDLKPDIREVITGRARAEMEEPKLSDTRGILKGQLCCQVLYLAEGDEGQLQSLDGMIPIQEIFVMEKAGDRDSLAVDWMLEDLTINLIHSRKVRIRAVLSFTITAEGLYQEVFLEDASSEGRLEVRREEMDLSRVVVQKQESFRISDSLELGGNKPNLGEIIWQEMDLRGADCRPQDQSLEIRGQLSAFIMYRAEGEDMPVQWEEFEVPFSGQIPLAESQEEMIPVVDVRLDHWELTPTEDIDGEMRRLQLTGNLKLQIHLYQNERVMMVRDLYSPAENVILEEKELELEHIEMRNSSRCRIQEKLPLEEGSRILQVCHGNCRVLVDETRQEQNGVAVDGALRVEVLYAAADDHQPIRTLEGMIPFRHMVEVPGMKPGCRYRLRWDVESLSIVMMGMEAAEVRASLMLELFVLRGEQCILVSDASCEPYDPAQIAAMPGIVGYRVQKGDTLWKIAKKFYTTVDGIRAGNPDLEEDVTPGQKLILIRQAEELEG